MNKLEENKQRECSGVASNLTQGITEGVSNSDYHRDTEYISSSGVKKMFEDPKAFYEYYVLGERSPIPKPLQNAFDFGSYVHTLILEPEFLEEEYIIYTGPLEDTEAIWELRQANLDKTVITVDQLKAANILFSKYQKENVVIGKHGYEKTVLLSSFFEDGFAEQTMCTELEGVKVKVRPDYRREFDAFGSVQDVKTTSEKMLTKKKVEKICEKYRYDISAAMYVDAVEKLTGKVNDFYFLFLSKSSNTVVMFRASSKMLDRGRKDYKEALRRLKEARNTGIYYELTIPELD